MHSKRKRKSETETIVSDMEELNFQQQQQEHKEPLVKANVQDQEGRKAPACNTNDEGPARKKIKLEDQRWASSSTSHTALLEEVTSKIPACTTTATETTAVEVSSEKQERRKLLILLVKIILKSLKEDGEILLHQQVRMVVSMVIRGHKLTQEAFGGRPLEEILESHLRPLVGESKWERAKHLQHHYLTIQRKTKQCNSCGPTRPRYSARNVFDEVTMPQRLVPI